MKKNQAILDLENRVTDLEAKLNFNMRCLDQYDMFTELMPDAVAEIVGYKKSPKYTHTDKDGRRHYTMGRVALAVDAKTQTLTIYGRGLSAEFKAPGGKMWSGQAEEVRERARRIRQGDPEPFVATVDLFDLSMARRAKA